MPVGRQRELEQLAALLADDAPVVVIGEAGVGKTTVLRAAAATTGRTVLEGGALSTLAWLDFLALERAIGRPMIEGDATAVARDVEAAVGDSLLLLDDLQWAGTATLDVVAQLAKQVAVVAGIRSGDSGTDRAVERLAAAGFTTIELGGLSPADSAEYVRSLRPDLSPTSVTRLVERAGGNPLLLRELAVTGEPSPSLRRALAARLRGLDSAGAEAFGLLALAGRPVSAEALGPAGVKSLLEADLAVVGPHGVEVRHALLAELAVDEMEQDDKRGLHARIGRNVHDRGEAARHYALAGEPERALEAALQALAATGRPGERASHLAVAASCASGPEADALRLRAAEALEIAHDWDTMLAMLDGLDPDDAELQAKACLLRARGAYSAGDADGLRAALAAGIALVDGTGSDVEVQLKIEQTRVPVLIDYDGDVGLPMAKRGLELARSRGVDIPRATYLLGTAQAIFAEAGAEDHLSEAITGARAAGDISTEFLAVSNLISTYEMNGDAAAGQELCTRYIERARELGLGEWDHLIRIARASLDFHAGAYERALSEAEDLLLHESDKRGNGQLVEMYCVSLIDVGRIDEALRRLTAAEPSLVEDSRGEFEALWVRTEAALWGGRPAEAMTLAQRYLTFPDQDANRFFGAPTLAWASFDLGLQPTAPPEVQDIPIVRAIPIEVEGVGALCSHEFDRAAHLLTEAATVWAPMHRRGELRSLWGAAEAARRGGSTERAVELLEAVEQRAQQHGMLPLLARVHRSLRAAGVRRSAPRTRHAGSSLTGRQREVLALVADGLTNAQVATRLGVSRHTVVTQLASASAKLGASSRAQAASLAAASSPA